MTSKPSHVDEYKAIVEVIKQYDEGGKLAKSSIMRPAFSQEATMFTVNNEQKLVGGAIEGLFDIVDNVFYPSPEARLVITRVDIVGTAASVRVDINDISNFCFTDFFHLLKIEGKWSVINKIYYTHVAP